MSILSLVKHIFPSDEKQLKIIMEAERFNGDLLLAALDESKRQELISKRFKDEYFCFL